MSGCGGGCSSGNSFNPGGHYVGIRINENEDGRVVFCETNGTALEKGQRVVVEGEHGLVRPGRHPPPDDRQAVPARSPPVRAGQL